MIPPAGASAGSPGPAAPGLSVVIPSYNRCRSLEMVLEALAAQRGVAPGAMETIVVLDGGTDGSAAMLTAWQGAGRLPGLRWQLRPNGGQAAARHAGAGDARAPVLLFIDDDVVPEPDLVARHLEQHAGGERIAVLGDCEIVRGAEPRYYERHVWSWWEELFMTRTRPGRLPIYQDFCAGNVSLRREDYLASGGFDPAFRGYGGEDYELGYRLMRQGVRLVADRRARARHHHRMPSYPQLLRQRQQEGRADVVLGRRHPELRAGLRLMKPEQGRARGMEMLAFTPDGMPERTLRRRAAITAWYERLRLRQRWAWELGLLTTYAYWRGVYEGLGSREALLAFRAEATVPLQHVDIEHGLPRELPGFWVHGPSDVRVTAGADELGTVRLSGPVREPLREALAEAIRMQLGTAVWLWTDRHGIELLPPIPDRREAVSL